MTVINQIIQYQHASEKKLTLHRNKKKANDCHMYYAKNSARSTGEWCRNVSRKSSAATITTNWLALTHTIRIHRYIVVMQSFSLQNDIAKRKHPNQWFDLVLFTHNKNHTDNNNLALVADGRPSLNDRLLIVPEMKH